MKYLISVFILSSLAFCNVPSEEEIQYDIYSSVLLKEFGHFSSKLEHVVSINDTIKDFKNELEELIYAVQNNELFFKVYCKGDTSFKHFILAIKTINTDKEIVDIERLKTKTTIKINLSSLIIPESWHYKLYFSKIELNNKKDKAILFVAHQSSGSWVFVELKNNRWVVKHNIISWII